MVWDIQKVLNWTQEYFKKNQIETPRLDAELILAFALGMKKIELYTQFDKILTQDELSKIKELIQRRIQKEPIAYIVGYKYFYKDKFFVNPDVLIPRPETEFIVEAVAELYEPDRSFFLLDIGTGSGAIAVSLQNIFPNADITASDISHKALAVAEKNESSVIGEKKITFIQSDIFSDIQESYDIIVSNPPYIPEEVFDSLDDDVRLYEPSVALKGGEDGLEFYRTFFKEAEKFLNSEGRIFLEIGIDIIDSVQSLIPSSLEYSFIYDYNNIKRVIHCRRK